MHTILRHSATSFPSWCVSATGRSLLAHLTTRAPFSSVLMPCYVPEGVIRPFQRRLPVLHYALNDDLSPNVSDLSATLKEAGACPLVIAINYFGYPNDMARVASVVHQRDGILLEDCAHCIGVAVGAPHADLILISFNKVLPTMDGAVLYSRRGSISFPGGHKDVLPHEAVDAYTKHLLLNKALARSTNKKEAEHLIAESARHYDDYYRVIRDDYELRQVKKESMLMAQSSDGWLMAERKHRATLRWQQALKPGMAVRFLPAYVAPMAVPIIVRNRDMMRERLLDAGIVAEVCVKRWDHIPKNDPRFENERRFRDNHLLLPCNDKLALSTAKEAIAGMMELQ